MAPADSPVAALREVRKHFGTQCALDRIDLMLKRGELHALLGPNGAGKTTAIALLLGLARADSGRVELFGADPQTLVPRRRVGVMLQSGALPETLRVGELLAMAANYYPRPRPLSESARLAGIGDLLKRPYGQLSGGQQRRVQFALALCGRSELLFLDEPTVGMDLEARERLWATIRGLVAEGCAVLLTTHDLEEAEALAGRVTVLARGRVLAEGSVESIRARVARKRIRCCSALTVESVRDWPGVCESQVENGLLTITTLQQAEPVLRRLLDADPHLSALEVQRAGLAEAFTELTREVA
ncbi:MAG: ABC transporter ATP-binding protein [Xanthomonadaceae bacterium]|nr:ABC transporter ATP-binding protein [Xanthomonadaceae bacterium]MDE2177230.1 ABC transporter ATP-binding protein [Xanthomonadaceae bacterium]